MLETVGNFIKAYPTYGLLLVAAIAAMVLMSILVMPLMRGYFRDNRQFGVTMLLSASTLFCLVLLLFRIYWTGSTGMAFLIWNLFLAWIPYWVALLLERTGREGKLTFVSLLILGVWLLFFPNAPYILTDLQYLLVPNHVPLWFSIIMLISFAWTGLLLGYMSLQEVQLFLQKRFRPAWTWLLTIGALVAASYGIFLGRYQRWNSWDIIAQPVDLLHDIMATMTSPRALGMTLTLSAFLILGYLTLSFLMQTQTGNRHLETEHK